MRKIGKNLLALMLAMSFLPVFAAEAYVNMKHEMRSVDTAHKNFPFSYFLTRILISLIPT